MPFAFVLTGDISSTAMICDVTYILVNFVFMSNHV